MLQQIDCFLRLNQAPPVYDGSAEGVKAARIAPPMNVRRGADNQSQPDAGPCSPPPSNVFSSR